MNKKLLSLLLVFVFAFTIAVPAFAADYSDLDGHWSETYMEDLADRGYLTGYEDGTMRPDNNMTACETLALLSRFYDPGDDALELIEADFADTVADAVPSSLSWAYDEIEICLAAGIITESELKSMDLTAEIEKEQLSVFLVRAMQLESVAEALSGTELTFDDADNISADCVGSVAELVALEIITGDDENNFSPNLSVTRAVVATMISRALDYLETDGITLVIEDYEGATRIEGIITSASGSSVTICGTDGLTRVYAIDSSSTLTVNGTARTLSSLYEGCYVAITANDGTVVTAAVLSDSDVTWVQGTIYSKFYSTTTKYLYLNDSESGDITKYTVSSSGAVTIDGSSVDFSYISSGYFATMKIEDDEVSELVAVTGNYEVTGTVSSIEYGTTVTLEVADDNGTVYCFYLDIADLPGIYRGTTAITVDRLSVGEAITVTVEGCEVTTISAESNEDTVTGELISTTTTTSGTQWTVALDDGTTATYTVDVNASVYSGSTSILLSAIQPGDTVSLVVYGSTVTEITLVTSVNSTTKVSGTVLSVDSTDRTITILTSSNKLVYIDVSSVSYILNTSTGKTLALSAVTADSTLVAYGTYESSTSFVATSIIIES